ncbi:DNA excision repair protein ERCC-1-like [Xenia sp. Carnegie-2017]|uniref:DNA excision repair protein ERCC-1-like n=1 Tax=Xenia sp. Carnegie-2017 TaxID=2897299 RepID=UPI001F03CE71|nr:DNA excision repair protein ERCC-1-like [Xenia sp. Carnegie-2017]
MNDSVDLVEVTPVFKQQSKSTIAEQQDANISKAKDTESSQITQLNEKQLIMDNSSNDIIEIGSPSCKDTADENQPKDIQVGKNFKETFAFIENTKYFDSESLERDNMGSKSKHSATRNYSSSSVLVNQRQKGNPLLKFFHYIPWEFSNITPDYVMGQRICALFLSIRYHLFNPNYIHERLKTLGKSFEVRILLVQVDVKDPHTTLKDLTKISILADCTLMLAWSAQEAARYIETYKIYENKPADALQGQSDPDYLSKLTECLGTVKSVNKTDTITLLSTFESFENIVSATENEIELCPGFGHQKAKRLNEAFNLPFVFLKKTLNKVK